MEAVRSFNNELSSLYEGKPPVSRAKMAQVTKCAIKAIKFYKHVVQSVEKFIQKCKPEYKVPGLYVIDSIVRQSRHQFGPEKDVFSPRFTKNIVNTFCNLFKCPLEERSRVVRVLNLWQKNSVFPVEVIQPLLDLAADPSNSELVTAAQRAVDAVVSVTQKVPLPGTHPSSNGGDANSNQILQQTEMLSTITKLLQQAQEGSISGTAPESQLQQLQDLQQQLVMQAERISKPHQQTPPIDSNLLAQIQVLTNQLLNKAGGNNVETSEDDVKGNSGEPLFNKTLLDFDYGDSDEDDDRQDHHHHHHHHHFQQRQPVVAQHGMPGMMHEQNRLQQIQIQQMAQQQEQLQSEIGAQEQLRRRVLEQQQFDREIGQAAMVGHHPAHGFNQNMDNRADNEQDERDIQESHDRADYRRRRGSRERSRSPRRRSRRSRSRSRDRRKRSRSRERHRRSRSRDRERREREKERERKKKGLPPLRENNISICSTTLWFGHLTKHTTEKELREHIENYGTIRTINMIPPRGCAFVCLTKRKDAFKALDRLKGIKINGNSLKVAWAPGIGVKESIFKDLWDVEQGVTYIPWEQLPTDIAPFIGGGMVDEDSLPERLKGMNFAEEDVEEPQQQQEPVVENEIAPPEDNAMSTQLPPQQMPMGIAGQLTNIQLAGQGLLNLLGPLGLLAGPPPIGMQPPGLRGNLGGPGNIGGLNNMGGLNNLRLPGNMGGLNNNMLGLPGLAGQGPNLPGIRPRPMNMGPQGHLMGQGNRMGGPMGVPSPGMDVLPSPAGMNSPGPRRPFGQFGNMPRFPHLQSPGGMRPPFFNNDGNDGDQPGMRDRDVRGVAEPKEWPPDDEVNAEDEQDEDLDSEERMLSTGGHQRMPRPGMPNMRPMGSPFGPRRPMLPGQVLSLHMMPPGQNLTGPGRPPNFSMPPQGGVRLPMPSVGVRPGMVPGTASPHLLPPSSGAPLPVSVNGSLAINRPPSNVPLNVEGADSPDVGLPPNSDMPQSSEDDMMIPHPQGPPMPFLRIPGGNRPPGGPFLGRGFAPMTIRPRGGPGLLGLRPGAQGGGGFNRFGGPRPLMGPFGGMDRLPFGNRFGMPLRPPMGFFDQGEREDNDEGRPSLRVNLQDHSRKKDLDDQNLSDDMDEDKSSEIKNEHRNMDVPIEADDRSKLGRASGRPSRWHDQELKPESAMDKVSVEPGCSLTTDTVSQPDEDQGVSAPVEVQVNPVIPSAGSEAVPGPDIAAPVDNKDDDASRVIPSETVTSDGESLTKVDDTETEVNSS